MDLDRNAELGFVVQTTGGLPPIGCFVYKLRYTTVAMREFEKQADQCTT